MSVAHFLQVNWFVKDAQKNTSSGQVHYEQYCTLKKTGMSVKEGEGLHEDIIRREESKISQGFQDRYKSLQVHILLILCVLNSSMST